MHQNPQSVEHHFWNDVSHETFDDTMDSTKCEGYVNPVLTLSSSDAQEELDKQLFESILPTDDGGDNWHGLEFIESLIGKGANVNAKNEDNYPLIIVALENISDESMRRDVTRLLLKYGADPNAESPEGNCALCIAITSRHYMDQDLVYVDLLRSFLDHGARIFVDENSKSEEPIQVLLENGIVAAVRLLFEYGISLEKFKESFPLHWAARNEDPDVLEYLLVLNCFDIEELDSEGYTPLLVAIELHNRECSEILLAYKAKVNYVTDAVKDSPLCVAVVARDICSMNLLIGYGADVNFFVDQGNTPLLTAVCHDLHVFADFLLVNGALISYPIGNEIDDDGSPLTLDISDLCFNSKMSTCLQRHKFLRSIQNANVASNNQNSITVGETDENEELKQNIKAEIESMQTSIISGTNITFYQYLTDRKISASHAKNRNVIELFNSDSIQEKFPLFSDTLICCYAEAQCDTFTLDKATEALGRILKFDPHVFHPISDRILAYFDMKDLSVLCLMCKYLQ
ncbi:hypothetical protein QAD02_023492 [Eretmocerus hayati]|uniref:Uncharacterized protein n=1 Tax=Eretmocerus hayati TaxID=131215 RepID=A0ACC2PW25_9HYME|nr:hypothetical protein QAD02_023492 [Eretmocerus hayati]